MTFKEPWSKRHKKVTAGLPHSLSNSFAEPLSNEELIKLSIERGDQAIVDEYNNHSLDYTPIGGSPDILEEIANLYGPNITADNIVLTAGTQVGIQTVATALLDENSHSIVFTPGYQSVQIAPVHAGSDVTIIELKAEDKWQIDPEKVKTAIQDNTKYIVANEPFNPAGTLMSRETQLALKEIADEHDIYIMFDEIYRHLEHDPKDRLPAMADVYEKGISAGGMSKPWGGCGITIGWIALQDTALKEKMVDDLYFGTICPSRASEIQAVMALRSSNYLLKRNVEIIKRNMSLLDQFFDDFSDYFSWIRPRAGATAFVKFKGPLNTDQLGLQLAQEGISIKPAYVFSDEVSEDVDYFRIGYGEKIMPSALEALRCFVEKHKKEWSS
ncbi:MAG: aminotransferase class I/II-fold pyridoxal phosphate-dependent enzyme [Emcibacteraceae bacterium]|nr:aminotransferase class I/II-fold pyridoxal phosphate-dependent enzyme [Emcibacteraceae bacterium]